MDTLATNFADIGAAHYLATAGLITAATPGSPEHVEAMILGPFLLRRTCFGRGSASTITGYALHAYRRALTFAPSRRQPIPRLSDAGIGATDAPTIARVLGCETSRVRRAVDALAVSDPSHGAAQARAIEWAADSEARIAEVAAQVLAEGGGALEIARAVVAIGGRVAP